MDQYKLMLAAAINAQLISLRARKSIAARWNDHNNHCLFERTMLDGQIRALEEELAKLA